MLDRGVAVVALRKTIHINAPPERVFDVLRRPERAPRWQPALLRAVRADGVGPLCQGARFDAVSVAAGARFEWQGLATHVDPSVGVAWRREAGDLERCDERWRLTAVATGTRLDLAADIELPFVMPRLVTEAEVREELSRTYDTALLNLKDILEHH